MLKSITRHREFTGPTPHSVAIEKETSQNDDVKNQIARPPSNKPADHLILERRRIEDLREKSISDSKYNKQCDLRSAWERTTDKRIQKNNIKREMMFHIKKDQMKLEERRDRISSDLKRNENMWCYLKTLASKFSLRAMLLAEEEQYIAEMESAEESIDDRRVKMKERARYLKEKREAERQAYVAEKLDQKFRLECEELRAEMSKQTCDEIFTDRIEQIRMKEEHKLRENEVEQFYADLWEQDTQAKAAKEEEETIQQIISNRDRLEVLNLQKMAIEQQRVEEKEVKKLEAEWLKEEAALRAYEEEELRKQKFKKQKQERRARDISLKLKARKEAKEEQEQLAMDMKMLQKVLQDTENQTVQSINKKKQLRDEMKKFMTYVENTRQEESKREDALEEFLNDEVEKQWKKKDDRKKVEKQARKLLLQNVLETRELQIKEREECMRNEHEAALKERRELREQMEEHKRLEQERMDRMRLQNRKYQNDLEQQINYQRQLQDKEIEHARKELHNLQNAEITYQRKLQSALACPDHSKRHPLRITGKSMGSRAKSC